MYLAAGQVVAKVTGAPWDDFIKQRIFQPLGMTSSNTSVTALKGVEDVATPHADVNDTVRAIPYRQIDNIAPAGSINSNAVDMAQWVRLQLGDGKFAGQAAHQQAHGRRDALAADGHPARPDLERHEPVRPPHGATGSAGS